MRGLRWLAESVHLGVVPQHRAGMYHVINSRSALQCRGQTTVLPIQNPAERRILLFQPVDS